MQVSPQYTKYSVPLFKRGGRPSSGGNQTPPPPSAHTTITCNRIGMDLGEDESMEMEGRLVEEKLLVSALECPVCLSLPHSLPVYTCRVGRNHLIVWKNLFACSKARHIKATHLFWSQVGHHVCGCCWRSLSGKCPVCLTDYSRWHQCGHWTHSIGRAFGHIGVYRNWFWTTKELHHSHDSPDRLRGVS